MFTVGRPIIAIHLDCPLTVIVLVLLENVLDVIKHNGAEAKRTMRFQKYFYKSVLK